MEEIDPATKRQYLRSTILLSGAVIFCVYAITLSPSISGGDSGELVAEGCILGVAHVRLFLFQLFHGLISFQPPGYPLFTLITYALRQIPYGSVAYRVNLFCTMCTTFASVYIGLSISLSRSMKLSFGGAIFGMGMFAFSPLIWQYATTAEVFPLNTMFASIIIYLTLVFSYHPDMKVVYIGAFVSGFALCNQHTIILLEFPMIIWILYLLRFEIYKRPHLLLLFALSFLLGMCPYIYLPITSSWNPKPGRYCMIRHMLL